MPVTLLGVRIDALPMMLMRFVHSASAADRVMDSSVECQNGESTPIPRYLIIENTKSKSRLSASMVTSLL